MVERLKPRLAVQREKINDVDNGEIKFRPFIVYEDPRIRLTTTSGCIIIRKGAKFLESPRLTAKFRLLPSSRSDHPYVVFRPLSPLTPDEFWAMLPIRSFLR